MEETIIELIRNEHSEILFLLRDLDLAVSTQQRKEFFRQIKNELIPGMRAEEKSVLKRLKTDLSDSHAQVLIEKTEAEHRQLRECVQHLNFLEIESPKWKYVFDEFKNLVERHCLQEEHDLFLEIKDDYSHEELVEIGQEFEHERRF
jgi:hypothetical protein